MRKDGRTAVAGEALQINGNIELQFAGKQSHLRVAHCLHFEELIERGSDSVVHGVMDQWTKRKTDDLEAAAIVGFKKPNRQLGRRVFKKITRKIANPDLCAVRHTTDRTKAISRLTFLRHP